MSRVLVVRTACVTLTLLAGGLVAAQDAPPPAEPTEPPAETAATSSPRVTRWQVDVEDWVAQPVGLGYVPTVRLGETPYDNEVYEIPHGTSDSMRYRVAYQLPANFGALHFMYWSHSETESWAELHPGQYTLTEELPSANFAGIGEDGTADGVTAQAMTETRDLRLAFSRPAFEGPRLRGRWSLGYRTVDHNRVFDASYYALIPPFPPTVEPLPWRATLDPQPDVALTESRFSGRGLDAAVDVTFPITQKVRLEGGISLAVLRGRTDVKYRSLTHFYGLYDGENLVQIVLPPFDIFEMEDEAGPLIDRVRQVGYAEGVQRSGLSTTASVLEIYLGFRWNAWRGLDVFGGFRNSQYEDVALDVRPSEWFQTDQTAGSVGYEGLFLGVGYTF